MPSDDELIESLQVVQSQTQRQAWRRELQITTPVYDVGLPLWQAVLSILCILRRSQLPPMGLGKAWESWPEPWCRREGTLELLFLAVLGELA